MVKAFLDETMKKIFISIVISITSLNLMAQQNIVQTAGRDALGEFAPEFGDSNLIF